MNDYVVLSVLMLITGVSAGWALAIYRMARDPKIHHLNPDEVICKTPPEGTVLMAVTPEIARRLVYNKDKKEEELLREARNILMQQ